MKHNIRTSKNQGTNEFHSTRLASSAPPIDESFIGDDGEVIHILKNGNSISKLAYDAMWLPKKTAIFPKHYKGKLQ